MPQTVFLIYLKTDYKKIWSIFLFVERCVVVRLVAAKVICQYMFSFT